MSDKNWLEHLRRRGILPRSVTPGMRFKDSVIAHGHLALKVIKAKSGEIVRFEEGDNLVVNGGRAAIAHCVAGDDIANQSVTGMTFGDGSGSVAVTDTGLFGTTIINKSVTYNFPSVSPPTQVAFVATVGQFEGNGSGSQDYREAGLLTGANALWSHKVFGLIQKTSDLVIEATWTVTF